MFHRRSAKPDSSKSLTLFDQCLQRRITLEASIDFQEIRSIKDLCQAVAQQRHKPILLCSLKLPLSISGVWTEIVDPISQQEFDAFFIAHTATPDELEHITCHELAHVLCGHAAEACGDLEIASLFRYLDLETALGFTHCRSRMDTEVEREAEIIATLLADRLDRTRYAGPLVFDSAFVTVQMPHIQSQLDALKKFSLE